MRESIVIHRQIHGKQDMTCDLPECEVSSSSDENKSGEAATQLLGATKGSRPGLSPSILV